MTHAYRIVDLLGREEWYQETVSLLNLAESLSGPCGLTNARPCCEPDIEYELRCV